jgi:PRC-barrel domain protein
MPRMPPASALAVLSALVAAPVPAQPPASPAGAPGAAVPPSGPASPGVAVGRLRQTHGGWRSSRIVGADVYNDNGQGIGTIDDLIVGQDGRVGTAVVSVGGFLGIGSKPVAVPYERLRLEARSPDETAAAGAPASVAPALAPVPGLGRGAADTTTPRPAPGPLPLAGTGPAGATPSPVAPGPNVATTRVVLPGASRDSLAAMPAFNYGT